MAQQHLRNNLAYLDVPVLGQPEAFIHADETLFDEAGNIGAGRNGKRRPRANVRPRTDCRGPCEYNPWSRRCRQGHAA